VAGDRRSTTSHVTTAATQIAAMNSYMLPIGQRSAAIPRVAIDVSCSAAPSTVSATAIRPKRSGRLRTGASSGPSAPTRTGTFARAAANSTAWKIIASA
jgi:hypothetical protein